MSARYDEQHEPIVLSKALFDILLKQESPAELIALYTFYYYTAKWQKTNQVRCTSSYISKGLNWGIEKIRKYRTILLSLGLIEDVQGVTVEGKFSGRYIKVNFIWTMERTNEMTAPQKNRVTEKPYDGKSATNALSDNNRNALSSNKGLSSKTSSRTKFPKKTVTPDTPELFPSKKTQTKDFIHLFPKAYRDNQEFISAYYDFASDRKARKKALTEQAVKRIVNDTVEGAGSDIPFAIRCFETAIKKGWIIPYFNKSTERSGTDRRHTETTPVKKTGNTVGAVERYDNRKDSNYLEDEDYDNIPGMKGRRK